MMRYYYLIYSLMFATALAVLLVGRKDLRKHLWPVIVLGAILNPLCELLYFRDYWQPDTLFGKGIMSLEDVIFGGSVAGLAVGTYAFLSGRTIKSLKTHLRLSPRRLTALLVAASVMFVLLNLVTGLNSVLALSITALMLWAGVTLQRGELFMPSLITGAAFAVVATLGYALGLNVIAPQVLDAWWLLQGGRLGITVFGNVPLTELIWFFTVGCGVSALFMHSTAQMYGARNYLLWKRRAAEPADDSIET